jgi:hypothetical protein
MEAAMSAFLYAQTDSKKLSASGWRVEKLNLKEISELIPMMDGSVKGQTYSLH